MPDFIQVRDKYLPQLEKVVPLAIVRPEEVPVDASLQEETADTEDAAKTEKNP